MAFVRSRDTILVVPASSSIASMRQRGRRHMMPLAKRLSAFLRCRTGFRVQVCDALTNKGIKGKSVETKGTEQRAQRLKGHVMVRPGVTLQNKAVILVDDIVTSGATMRRCVDALTSQGALVITSAGAGNTLRPADLWRRKSSLVIGNVIFRQSDFEIGAARIIHHSYRAAMQLRRPSGD
ncbi:MAG: ComF family protein [Bifidobacterium adolescentis]